MRKLLLAALLPAAAGIGLAVAALNRPKPNVDPPRPALGLRPPADGSWRQRVKQYLEYHANDPASVQIISVRYADFDQPKMTYAWVCFRERNGFGMTEYRELVLASVGGGPLIHREDMMAERHQITTWSEIPP